MPGKGSFTDREIVCHKVAASSCELVSVPRSRAWGVRPDHCADFWENLATVRC